MTDSDHPHNSDHIDQSDRAASAGDSDTDLLTLTTTRTGSTAVVTVAGELDLQTSRDLLAEVDRTLQWPDLATVVIDLSRVSFLGSSGLGTLAELASRTTVPPGPGPYPVQSPSPRPALRLVAPPDNMAVIRPWQTMNLQPILPLHPDISTALGEA